MKAVAEVKSVRISPRKVAPVADMIRGQKAEQAQTTLAFTSKRAAAILSKALNSAIANAQANHGLNKADLVVEAVNVGPGITLKRYRARSRGAAYPILKYSSRIKVIVSDEQKNTPQPESMSRTAAKSADTKQTTSASAPDKKSQERVSKDNHGS